MKNNKNKGNYNKNIKINNNNNNIIIIKNYSSIYDFYNTGDYILIPFNLDTFSLLDFKDIITKDKLFTRDNNNNILIKPYVISVFDCTRFRMGHIDCSINLISEKHESEYNYFLVGIWLQIIGLCTEWSDKFSHVLPNSDNFYIHIYKI